MNARRAMAPRLPDGVAADNRSPVAPARAATAGISGELTWWHGAVGNRTVERHVVQRRPGTATPEPKTGHTVLSAAQVKSAVAWYSAQPRYTPDRITEIQQRLGLTATGVVDGTLVQAVAQWQASYVGDSALAPNATKTAPGEPSGLVMEPNGHADALVLARLFPYGMADLDLRAQGGLADVGYDRLAKDWDRMPTVEEQATAVMQLVAVLLERNGTPVPHLVFTQGETRGALFSANDWSIHVDGQFETEFQAGADRNAQINSLLATMIHEAQHAEQSFLVYRWWAGLLVDGDRTTNLPPDADPAGTLAQEIQRIRGTSPELAGLLAERAVAAPIESDSIPGLIAAGMENAMGFGTLEDDDTGLWKKYVAMEQADADYRKIPLDDVKASREAFARFLKLKVAYYRSAPYEHDATAAGAVGLDAVVDASSVRSSTPLTTVHPATTPDEALAVQYNLERVDSELGQTGIRMAVGTLDDVAVVQEIMAHQAGERPGSPAREVTGRLDDEFIAWAVAKLGRSSDGAVYSPFYPLMLTLCYHGLFKGYLRKGDVFSVSPDNPDLPGWFSIEDQAMDGPANAIRRIIVPLRFPTNRMEYDQFLAAVLVQIGTPASVPNPVMRSSSSRDV